MSRSSPAGRDRLAAPRDPSQPQPGYFKLRLVRGGPLVPARIRLLPAQTWQAVINDEAQSAPHADPTQAAAVFRIWLGAERCTSTEYFRLLALKRWALQMQPEHPLCHPHRPIDLDQLPPIVPAAAEARAGGAP